MPIKLDWSGWGVDGNLALDKFEALPDEGEAAHLSPIGGGALTETTESIEEMEPGLPETEREGEIENPFPLSARKSKRMEKRTLAAVVLAFKESCRCCGITYGVKEDKQWRPRVVLSGKRGGLALLGLEIKLDQTPELEAFLLLELAQKDAALQELLDERAAIRAADGLSDDLETAALLAIGAEIC